MNKKERKEYNTLKFENEINRSAYKKQKYTGNFLLVFTIIIALFFTITLDWYSERIEKLQNQNFNETTFYEKLDEIKDNCGSLHIVKNPQSNLKGYYVFAQQCKYGNYCKYDYININECYN